MLSFQDCFSELSSSYLELSFPVKTDHFIGGKGQGIPHPFDSPARNLSPIRASLPSKEEPCPLTLIVDASSPAFTLHLFIRGVAYGHEYYFLILFSQFINKVCS
jgi:hypothetical protein